MKPEFEKCADFHESVSLESLLEMPSNRVLFFCLQQGLMAWLRREVFEDRTKWSLPQ